MLVKISDPMDASVYGELYNDSIAIGSWVIGLEFTLFFSSTGADSNDALFDLSSPPTYHGAYSVWCILDHQSTLNLYLSPTSGDTSYPFGRFENFGLEIAGTGDLFRPGKLPPRVDWSVAP